MCLQWITLTAECHTRAQFIFCSTLTHELFRCRSWYVGTQFVCVVCLRRRTLLSAITGAFLPDLICRWAVEYGSFHCPSNQARITGVLQCGFFYFIGRPVQFTLSCLTHYCISIWCSAVWSKDGMKAGILYFGGTLVVTTKPLHRPETPVGRRAEWDLSETFHCESNLFLHKQLLYLSAQPWSVCWASRYIYIYMYDIILYEGVFMKWWPVTVTPFQSCKCSGIVSLWVSVLQTQVA